MPQDELDGFGRDVDDLFGENGGDSGQSPADTPAPEPVRPPQPDKRENTAVLPDALKQMMSGMLFKTALNVVVFLLILAGAAHALYSYFFPGTAPADSPEVTSMVEVPAVEPLPPDSLAEMAQPAIDTATSNVPDEEGEFVIQVGLCVYPSCVTDFQDRLRGHNLTTEVTEVSTTWQSVEVYSETTFQAREQAEVLANRINREQSMEEQAYVRADSNEFRISMGNFDNSERATTVRDQLNRILQSEATFATRVWEFPQRMHSIVAGDFSSRREAEAVLNTLVQADSVFRQAYVVRK
jgi:hypothetical protein